MNREKRVLIYGSAALVIASLLFLFLYTGEPSVTPVGEQVGSNQTQGSSDEIGMSDELLRSQELITSDNDQLNFTDSIKFVLSSGHGGLSSSGGGGHGGGGGGGARDRTPPTVTGIFSRPPDTVSHEYNQPVTVTWIGDDGPRGSGIDFCDLPTNYSGPDATGIRLVGDCTDNEGNEGTGDVTLNYNSTEAGNLAHSYSLSLNSTEIPVGSGISASATTNNTGIKNVKFVWMGPSAGVSASNIRPTIGGSTNDFFTVPNQTGVWLVEAHFLDTASNDVITLTENFAVVQPGGGAGSPFTYSLTVNPDPVEKNNPIAADATTNNTGITEILFVWFDPLGTIRASHEQPLGSASAIDSFTPNVTGEWRVDAHFNNATHTDVAIRIKSFTVIEPSDTTPPTVTGIFSRPPDTIDDSYTHPVTITWVGDDGPDGSGIAFCDEPITYSGPDAEDIVREGRCTDNDGNVGTGSVTFNFNSTSTSELRHFYDLSLSSSSVQIGSSISANATTNNTSIQDVRFVWRNPSNGVAANNIVPTAANDDIRTAVDLFASLNQTGIWAVDAHFLDSADNDVFVITKIFSVVQQGGGGGGNGSSFNYSLTVNPETVERNNPVTANATSNNTSITNVNFVWTDALGSIRATHVKPLISTSVLDSFTPDTLGQWRVDAHFNNATHSDVAIRSETFTVIKGGSTADTTPPIVTGIFSRNPDTIDGEFTHPISITWVGNDGPGGSGIDFCDAPTNYSGPDGSGIVREGQCTDNAGNVGTGSVNFNYNSTATGGLAHFYALSLSNSSVSMGSSISANATTNNTSINDVQFVWKNPSNSVVASNIISTLADDDILSAVDIFTALDQTGIWTVDAHFLDTASNNVFVITKTFVVVREGGDLFAYDLTVNPETIEKNHEVKANATTDNPSITNVTVVWTNPLNIVAASDAVPMPPDSATFRSVIDLFAPDSIGAWRVDAHFNNSTHTDVAIRSETFTVVKEGGGGTGNHPSVARNDDYTTPEDTPVVIDILANDTDVDGDTLTIFSFTQPRNGSVTENANGTLTYSPSENFNGEDTFTYRISDGKAQSNNATVTILVTPLNDSPIVNAGPDQNVNEETLVTLDGSVIDDNGGLKFAWSQIILSPKEPVVTLSDRNTLSPSFMSPSINHTAFPPSPITLAFQLLANDTSGAIGSDTVLVTVNDVNKLPVADAGPDQTVNECSSSENEDDDEEEDCSSRTLVTLSGSDSSDADGDDLAFSWNQTDGPPVELSNANSAIPLFTAPEVDEDTILMFNLTVSDGFGGNSTDSVKITILDNEDNGGGGGDDNEEKIQATGGGAQIGEKVNFGFSVQSLDGEVKGNLEYQDRAADINVHSISMTLFELIDDNRAKFEGTATINGEGEYKFIVVIEDNGEPGDKDFFSIEIPELPYEKSGNLTKGNIQLHE